jgi:hypothetical protein
MPRSQATETVKVLLFLLPPFLKGHRYLHTSSPCRDDATFTCVDTYGKRGATILSQSLQLIPLNLDNPCSLAQFHRKMS